MGCDIHAYIEFKKSGDVRWRSFGGRINPGRHYGIFAKLANVRNGWGIVPIAEPRGLASDAGYAVDDDNQIYITQDGGDNYCTHEQAARYVQNGSKYVNDSNGKPTWVTHPDWHSHSWANAQEIEHALTDPKVEAGSALEYRAIIAALKSFEAHGCTARLVFWFDN